MSLETNELQKGHHPEEITGDALKFCSLLKISVWKQTCARSGSRSVWHKFRRTPVRGQQPAGYSVQNAPNTKVQYVAAIATYFIFKARLMCRDSCGIVAFLILVSVCPVLLRQVAPAKSIVVKCFQFSFLPREHFFVFQCLILQSFYSFWMAFVCTLCCSLVKSIFFLLIHDTCWYFAHTFWNWVASFCPVLVSK